MGAIAPKINKFAFDLLTETSNGLIKPQFPTFIGPPVFISLHENLSIQDVSEHLPDIINDYEEKHLAYSIKDWFNLSSELTPYSHSSSILIPAYFYLEGRMEELIKYLKIAKSKNLSEEIQTYHDEFYKMID